MSINCYYHPDREATAKCEKCGKVICVECKMIFRRTVHRGTGDDSYAYSERYEFCPVCYYDANIKKYKKYPYPCLGFMFIFIIATIMFTLFTFELDNPLSSLGITLTSLGIFLSLVVFIYLKFVYSPKKTSEFNAKKEEFLQNIKTPRATKTEEIATNFCPECGTKVEPDASVCSYCGFIIKE